MEHFAFEGEFFGAEVAFSFLNGGVALADGGVFGAVDEGPELFDDGEVVGVVVAVVGDSEVEGHLLEDFEGLGGKGRVAGGGVASEFDGDFFGGGEFLDLARGIGAVAVANEGHEGNFFLKFGLAECDDFTERDSLLEPSVDVLALAFRVSGFQFREAARSPDLGQD